MQPYIKQPSSIEAQKHLLTSTRTIYKPIIMYQDHPTYKPDALNYRKSIHYIIEGSYCFLTSECVKRSLAGGIIYLNTPFEIIENTSLSKSKLLSVFLPDGYCKEEVKKSPQLIASWDTLANYELNYSATQTSEIKYLVNEVIGQLNKPGEEVLSSLLINKTNQLLQIKTINEINNFSCIKPQTKFELYKRLERAKDFIDLNFERKTNIKQIASAANLAISHFLIHFKKVYGITPYKYIIQKRLELVKELLISTNLPVNEIMYYAGTTNHSAFSRLFKKWTGKTPQDFRTNHCIPLIASIDEPQQLLKSA